MRYQSTRPKRQFLAGVVCTHCQSTDSTVYVQIFEPVADEYIECTVCGHSEHRPTAQDIGVNSDHSDVGVVKFHS